MLSMLNPWKWGTIGLAIVLVASLGWGARVNSLRAGWQEKYVTLDGQAQNVLMATRTAADNPKLDWPNVPTQIAALASSNRDLKASIDSTNGKLDVMGAETARLIASGNEFRSQLAIAQAGRSDALARLKAMALVPGDRQSCPALLSQTTDALDLAYGSGL